MWDFSCNKEETSFGNKVKNKNNASDKQFYCLSESEDLISQFLAKDMCSKLKKVRGFKKRKAEVFLTEVFAKLVKKH